MALQGCLDRTGKIVEGCMIDFEGNWTEPMGWIAKRHLACVAKQAEAGHVSDGMNGLCGPCFFFNFLQAGSGGGVESAHGADGGRNRCGGCAIFFQACRYDSSPQRLRKKQHIPGLGSYVAPNSLRIDLASDCVTEQHVFVADGMAADHAALC